jgi:hypothetical protein
LRSGVSAGVHLTPEHAEAIGDIGYDAAFLHIQAKYVRQQVCVGQWLAENFDRVCELPVTGRWSVIRHEAAGKLHVTKMRKRAAFEIEEA